MAAFGIGGNKADTIGQADKNAYYYGGGKNDAHAQAMQQQHDATQVDSRQGYGWNNKPYNLDNKYGNAAGAQSTQAAGNMSGSANSIGQSAAGITGTVNSMGQAAAGIGQATNYYGGMLNGTQPSQANAMMQQGLQQSAQNAQNIAASGGANNQAMALHAAMYANQTNSLAAAQQGAQNRIAEQQAAAQGLTNAYGAQANIYGQQANAYGTQAGAYNNQAGVYGAQAGAYTAAQNAYTSAASANTANQAGQSSNYYANQTANDQRHQNDEANAMAIQNSQLASNQAYQAQAANISEFNSGQYNAQTTANNQSQTQLAGSGIGAAATLLA